MSKEEMMAKLECLDDETVKLIAQKLDLTNLNDTAKLILMEEIRERKLNGCAGCSQDPRSRKS